MESSEKSEMTPRRSTRLQRQRAADTSLMSEKSITIGPREYMRLNRSKQNVQPKTIIPEITIIPPTPASKNQKTISNEQKETLKTEQSTDIENQKKQEDVPNPVSEEKIAPVNTEASDATVIPVEVKSPINSDEITKTDDIKTDPVKTEEQKEETQAVVPVVKNEERETHETIKTEENSDKQQSDGHDTNNAKQNMNETPQLMNESIISVPESPPMTNTIVKDATFSPEVDTSIHDSRPHIDRIFEATPIFPKTVALRTSTPLSKQVLLRETPKLPGPVISAIKKVLSPKITENKKLNEESLSDTFGGQIKFGNPLEKSILKSTRKRSLSVTDGESFMQKKVVFISPEIMNIDRIDEKMLQSFKEEKETSILKQALASGSGLRRKRSQSESGTPGRLRKKVPNFKAIHDKQVNKMESVDEYLQRRFERAKRLGTPLQNLATVKEKQPEQKTKIPTRKPMLTKVASTENLTRTSNAALKKRSNSTDLPVKASNLQNMKVNSQSNSKKIFLPRILDENLKVQQPSKLPVVNKVVNVPAKPTTSSAAMRSKLEERREKNMSLYKNNSVRTVDHRKKNENVLKGVRLNRRFELQMQHRRITED